MVDEQAIRNEVLGKINGRTIQAHADHYTPSGRPRSAPTYEATIDNGYLGISRIIKGKSISEVHFKVTEQLTKWAEQEIKRRVAKARGEAIDQAKQDAEEASEAVQQRIADLKGILVATLSVDDRLDWEAMMDQSRFPDHVEPEAFSFAASPSQPRRRLHNWLLPWTWAHALRNWQIAETAWTSARDAEQKNHQQRSARAREEWKAQRDAFHRRQSEHNEKLDRFRKSFEGGEPASIEEYVRAVFERSVYPDCFFREYRVGYDVPSKTVVVDIGLPPPEAIPNVAAVKFDAKAQERREILMKPQDHDDLYDSAIKQCILRTAHEIFESAATPHVEAAAVNGWVTRLDPAVGNDVTSCIITVSVSRQEFQKINLKRVDPDKCIKALKGLVAGPLASIAPVRPILQLQRTDPRFIEAREVLADVNSATNLAEVPWEDFEHLVRELFAKLFSSEGAEVKVTRSSRDAGVDAIAFDPDPIRGGKFVIQSKRYTNVVPVSAVRDLYGTMINEGATKGILVTTAYYGRDSREFAQDKPLTLIDGPNLVYLLEQHGHKVRIDLDMARRNREPAGD